MAVLAGDLPTGVEKLFEDSVPRATCAGATGSGLVHAVKVIAGWETGPRR
jgi:hypothetical protein